MLNALNLYGQEYGHLITSSLQHGYDETVITLITDNLCKLCALRLYDILTAFIEVRTILKPERKTFFKKDGESKKDKTIKACLKEIKKRSIDDEYAQNCPYPAFALLVLYAVTNVDKYWKCFIANVEKIQKDYEHINIEDMKRCRNPESALSWEIVQCTRYLIPIKRCTPLKRYATPILLENLNNINDSRMVRKLICFEEIDINI